MKVSNAAVMATLLAFGVIALLPEPAAAASASLLTDCVVLIGGLGASPLAVPENPMLPETKTIPEGGPACGFEDRLDAIVLELKDAYGLDWLEPAFGMGGTFRVGEAETIVTPIKDIELEVTVVSFTSTHAVYSVKVRDRGKVVEEPVVSIKRGEHGIVEGRDGRAAPYFFLLIHPVLEREASEYPDGFRPPRLMNNVESGCLQEAERERSQRLVVLGRRSLPILAAWGSAQEGVETRMMKHKWDWFVWVIH